MDCDAFEYLAAVHQSDQELRYGTNLRKLRAVTRGLEKLCADHVLIPLLRAKIADQEAGVVPRRAQHLSRRGLSRRQGKPPTYVQH
jgi:hypothetical protein